MKYITPLFLLGIIIFPLFGSGFGAEVAGVDYMHSNNRAVRFSALSFHTHYISADPFTLAITQSRESSYISFNFLIMIPLVLSYSQIQSENSWINRAFWVAASPQIIGNFDLHLPLFSDRLSLILGESTDYYFRKGIFTESKVGIHTHINQITFEATYNKPWLKGALDTTSPYFAMHIGFFLNLSFYQ